MEKKDHLQTGRKANILDLEKFRLKMKLRDSGVEVHEDRQGKFKVWLRLAGSERTAH